VSLRTTLRVLAMSWLLVSCGFQQCANAESAIGNKDVLCGPQCLLSICHRFGVETTIDQLTDLCGTDEHGTTLYGLCAAAKKLGLEASAMKIGVDELIKLQSPSICYVWVNHYVVASGRSDGLVDVTDPPRESGAMALEDFRNYYSGYAVLISRNPLPPPTSRDSGPDCRFGDFLWEFGYVDEGTKLQHRFEFVNKGNEPLSISKIESSCGCTAGIPGLQVIPPGESSYVDVNVDTSDRLGILKERLTVHTNDRITPIVQLEVFAEVGTEAGLLFSPRSIDFGVIRRGEDVHRALEVRFSGKGNAKIIASCDSKRFSITTVEKKDASGYIVTITPAPDAPLGVSTANLSLSTGETGGSKVVIPVRAVVRGNVDTTPDRVFFGIIKRSDLATRKITISSSDGSALRITKVRSSLRYLSVAVAAIEKDKQYELVAKLNDRAPLGYIEGEIVVTTTSQDQRRIRVPVYALVQE
jgi:hypothetical protein